jgi:MFS family permease
MSTSTRTTPIGPLARAREELAAFPPQFWLLALGVVVLLSGIDMCFPFETIFLTQHKGVPIATVDLILGIPLLVAIPLYVVGGALVDRFGRRPGMVIGAVVISVLYATFALAGGVWQIAVMIAVEAGFGWSLFLTASNAMVADLVVHERRAEAYSFTRIALAVGMIIGPVCATLLIGADPTFRALFLTGAALCAAFVVVVLVFFRETKPASTRAHSLGQTFAGYAAVFRDRRFVAFCALSLLPLYGFGQIWTNLPVALRERYTMPASRWSLLLVTYAITMIVLQYPVVRAFRHANHMRLLAVSSAFIGVGLCGTVLAPWGPLTFPFMVVLGLGIVLLIPITATVAAELAPVALRGRYMGAWTLVQEAGYALGLTVGGVVMQAFGSETAFVLVGACGLLGCVLFTITAPRFGRPEPVEPDFEISATAERP